MPDPNTAPPTIPQTQPSPNPQNDRPLSDAFAPIGADQSLDINQGLDLLLSRLASDPRQAESNPDRIAEANQRAIQALQRQSIPNEEPAQQGFERPRAPSPDVEAKEGQPTPAEAPSDDTFIEWEGDNGQRQRVPVNEAILAIQSTKQLQQQLQQMQSHAAQMPEQMANAIMGAAQTRRQLLQEVENLQRIYQPQPPPRALLDKTSPHYDPEKYAAMLADFDRGRQWLGQVEQAKQRQQQTLNQEQSALHEATIARGRAQLMQGMQTGDGTEGWPELFQDPRQQTSLGDLLRWAGYDPQSALVEGLAARRAKRAPPRPVRSAPRLVRGAGRVQPGADETSADMASLAKTGSYQTAEDVIMRILQSENR